MSRTIAVATGKGGVGKTSITANVAGLLAAAEFKVLAIDLDSQSNLGEDLGYTATGTDDGLGAFQSIAGGQPLVPMKDIRENLDVVPAGDHTEDLIALLDGWRTRKGEQTVIESLAVSLAPIADNYDVILLDCPPKGRALQEIALGAARWLLIPTKSDASSRKAIGQIAERFTVARNANPTLDLLGVVLFGTGSSAMRLRRDTINEIAQDLKSSEPLFGAMIRHAEASAVQARNSGRLIHELERDAKSQEPWYKHLRSRAAGDAPSAGARPIASSVVGLAGDYQQLAEEIVTRLERVESATDETTTEVAG